jgi:hypothetical protein
VLSFRFHGLIVKNAALGLRKPPRQLFRVVALA